MASIYTRKGDDGTTSLPDGTRVSKDDLRVEAYGALDEANCRIGMARPALVDNDMEAILTFIQQRLFNCAASLSWKGGQGSVTPKVTAEDVAALEKAIDLYSDRMPHSEGFVLPGADEASARLHVARASMRRAERTLVKLRSVQEVDPQVLAFVNRASDLLFVAARNASFGGTLLWDPDAPPPDLTFS
jgi:cob(I)alamin adenosyltransferase